MTQSFPFNDKVQPGDAYPIIADAIDPNQVENRNPERLARHIDYARKLARTNSIPTILDRSNDLYPDKTKPVIIVGAGPTLRAKKGGFGGELLRELNQRTDGPKVLASMALGMVEPVALRSGAQIAIFGGVCERMPGFAALLGNPAILDSLKAQKTQLALPTYVEPEVLQCILEHGLGDQLSLWEPSLIGLDPVDTDEEPLMKPIYVGSAGVSATVSVMSELGARRFDFYGVDRHNPGIPHSTYATRALDEIARECGMKDDETTAMVSGDLVYEGIRTRFAHEMREDLGFFARLKARGKDLQFTVHGDSATAEIMSQPSPIHLQIGQPGNDRKPTIDQRFDI